MKDLQPDYCKECNWVPVCLGICNRQIIANPGKKLCNLDGLKLSRKEFLIYLFKLNILRNKLYN